MGSLFAGRFKILGELGKGGMGRVYRVLDTKVDEIMALKLLDPLISADGRIIERFKNEMKFARQISHRNVCRMYDLNEAEGAPFITMEYVDGEDLKSTIRRVGPLGIGKAVGIGRQVCEGLTEAHRLGVIHRDLKPQNIMLDQAGDARIMDFGISRSLRGEGFTGTGVVIGTPEYMSPEQVEGSDVDGRADIYALGAVLFEMVTGEAPFHGDSAFAIAYKQKHDPPPDPAGLNPLIPDDLRLVILKCLEKNRDMRYPRAEYLLTDLAMIEKRLVMEESSISAKGPADTIRGRARIAPRTRRLLSAVMAALAVMAVLAVLFLLTTAPKSPPALDYQQITFSGSASLPAFSPDGKSLAYFEQIPSGGQRIMVQDLSGGPPLEVFRSERCLSLRWLPDGSEISVVVADTSGQRRGLFLIPRLGGSARFLETRDGLTFMAWSPDGSHYAYPQGVSVWIVNRATGESERIPVQGAFIRLVDLDWSPSGDRLAVTSVSRNREYSLVTIRTDGSQQRDIVAGLALIASPRWSSRGDALYFLQGREGSNDLWKIAISPKTGAPAGEAAILIPGLQTGISISITKDGTTLAYNRIFSSAQLWAAEAADPNSGREPKTTILTTGTAVNRFPSISPDGRRVAFVRITGQTADVFVMPLVGGPAEQITFLDSMNFGPAWSPDGGEISFISTEGDKARIWKIAASGGKPASFDAGDVGGYSLAWNPGRRILYQTIGNRNIGMVDPESGQADFLFKGTDNGWLFNPKYSPDGKRLAVLWNRSTQAGIWSVSAGDGRGNLIFPGTHLPVGWSGDGRWIYAANVSDQTLEIIAVDTEGVGTKGVMKVPVDRDKGVPDRFSSL